MKRILKCLSLESYKLHDLDFAGDTILIWTPMEKYAAENTWIKLHQRISAQEMLLFLVANMQLMKELLLDLEGHTNRIKLDGDRES